MQPEAEGPEENIEKEVLFSRVQIILYFLYSIIYFLSSDFSSLLNATTATDIERRW